MSIAPANPAGPGSTYIGGIIVLWSVAVTRTVTEVVEYLVPANDLPGAVETAAQFVEAGYPGRVVFVQSTDYAWDQARIGARPMQGDLY